MFFEFFRFLSPNDITKLGQVDKFWTLDLIQLGASKYLVSIISTVSTLWNLVSQEHFSYQTPVASKSWLLFLKGVREGSPSRKLAIILPANIDIIDENHKASGCFREKAIAPETKMIVLCIFIGTYMSLKSKAM